MLSSIPNGTAAGWPQRNLRGILQDSWGAMSSFLVTRGKKKNLGCLDSWLGISSGNVSVARMLLLRLSLDALTR